MEEKKHRWVVKESLFADWRELPGEHTATEIWLMRWRGKFWAAKRLETKPALKVVIPPK